MTQIVTVPGMRAIPKTLWDARVARTLLCRSLRAQGFGDGTPEYEAALEELRQKDKGVFQIGHVNALEAQIAHMR